MTEPHGEPTGDLGFELPPPARTSRTKVVIVIAILAGGAFTFGYLQHRKAHGEVPAVPDDTKVARVQVTRPVVLTSDHALSLPGTVRPLEETRIYPRVSGYVKSWLVDIGDKVTAGQALAEIETPELAQQLLQARAQLAQAQAAVQQANVQRDFSKANTSRYQALSEQNLISKAQVEQTAAQAGTDEAQVSAARSNVASQEANVRRLVEQQKFSKVEAPFAGTVTTRTVDRGQLVTEGNATPMFTIVATDPVRILLDVPQSIAPSVRPGTDVAITVREYSGRTFAGKVTRSSGALDPSLHTMVTEVQVPNADGALFPGMYVQATLTLAVPHRVLEIPATALYSDSLGLRVATVVTAGAAHRVHFAQITIERDTGGTLQIATGLTGDEQIIKVVPSLIEGDVIELAK